MHLEGMDLAFPREYLRAALMVSLLSVWLLVGLFYYLNRYTKREYFTVWMAAWLFYALWLTLSLTVQNGAPASLPFLLKQACVAISAVFMLWGSLRFLRLEVPQRLFGLFMAFVVVWTVATPHILANPLQVQVPVFVLLAAGSVFAGVAFHRVRKQMPFVGAGMLSLGFLLWGIYLGSYPFSQQYEGLYSAGFLVAAVLQLFIAVSMIVLVLEEVRYNADQVNGEIERVRLEKEALHVKVLTTEERCRDLYNQVRLSEGLQKAYEELRQAQQVVVQQERLRALGQMSSGIAHDVNNALSPIVAYSEVLLKTLPDLAEAPRRYLQTIKRCGDDIAQIVSRMREFYRPRSEFEQLQPVNINEVIEEVIGLTRPRWRDQPQRDGISIEIQRELSPETLWLRSDPTELREALINLVFNAVDALPQGGLITVSSRAIKPSAPSQNDAPQSHIQVEVRDNGIGMDEKTKQRCLEPFFSTKAMRGGTGLGLAMVYGMIQRHDGKIEIDSAPGRGTSITLTFPVREAANAAATPQPAPEPQSRSLRILCIDDEPKMRQLLSDCLGDLSHQVTVAESGRRGMELFHNAALTKDAFQIVITDLGMPDVDGHEVARAIKADSPKTPVIMMTGWASMLKDMGEPTAEVDAVLPKPPSIQALQNLLVRFGASQGALNSIPA
jgi:signal transduction histidine kinase/CheY-like chemotaxis protein